MSEVHRSVLELANRYFDSKKVSPKEIHSFYFCDNEKDANQCADLVLSGDKRATASSLWWFEINDEALPQEQDIYIVTNWSGVALCVIEVEKVQITPFSEVSREFAETEGEGDKSLEYWRKVHWEYYHRELAGSCYEPSQEMPIVCEFFRVIFK